MTEMTTPAFVRGQLPNIERDMNKFDRGRLFLIAGSYGMAGAAIMAGRAALRSGVGFLHLAVPAEIYGILAPVLPEAVFSVYHENEPEKLQNLLQEGILKADAVAVGCGLGLHRELLCPMVFESCDKPLLLDADGLNFLAEAGSSEQLKTDMLVLTPHAGEMGRLLDIPASEVNSDREGAVKAAVEKYSGCGRIQTTVLLKGADTLVGRAMTEEEKKLLPKTRAGGTNPQKPEPFRFLQNPTGNPGLARAGSGDTLTGIIGALMAQGMAGFEAAASGAYLHGKAAELAAGNLGIRSVLPTDVSEYLPETFLTLEGK